MQVELIGCTSAGKSTLIQGVLQAGNVHGVEIILGDDFVLQQLRLHRIAKYLPRGLLINWVGLASCLLTWHKNYRFYGFAVQRLLQLPIAWTEKLYMFRNVLKKVGVHEIIRFFHTGEQTNQQVILVDEGVLQVAHNLFVHLSTEVDLSQLTNFVQLSALPDLIVYLRQPETLLIDRTIKRGHARIPDRSYENVARFIQQAVATFERLVQEPAIECKLLVVDGYQEVAMAAKDHHDRRFESTLQIIRSGLVLCTPIDASVP